MRTVLSIVASLFLLVCLVGGCGGGDGGGSGVGGGGAVSDGEDMAKATAAGDMGLLGLAQPCTKDAQCASNRCAPYAGGTKMLCSFMCTKGMPAPMCTAPGDATCNGMGFCKFPGMN